MYQTRYKAVCDNSVRSSNIQSPQPGQYSTSINSSNRSVLQYIHPGMIPLANNPIVVLEPVFKHTLTNHGGENELTDSYWKEIVNSYSHKKRVYHNLAHIDNLLTELETIKADVNDWDCMIFAIAYHDIIYNATATDNEERSAALAVERLQKIALTRGQLTHCSDLILATKGHAVSKDRDINLFTDADLSILGKPWSVYQAYSNSIRKEYSIYPDLLYKPGRKKVLEHFIKMDRIFKTNHFYALYEKIARENLKRELSGI